MTILFDKDGNEVEVPSTEEIQDLKIKAEAAGNAAQLSQLVGSVREALGIDESADITEAVKLAKESANPNWPQTRAKLGRMQEFIKNNFKGAQIQEDGSVNLDEKIDLKVVEERARSAAKTEILGQEINKHLLKYPQESREVVKKYFEKLIAGEDLNLENVSKFMGDAGNLAIPNNSRSNTRTSGGVPILDSSDGARLSETPEGKNVANQLFGDESFAKERE